MSLALSSRRCRIAAVPVALSLTALAAAQSTKLSGPPYADPGQTGADVTSVTATPDGERILYTKWWDPPGSLGAEYLFSVPADGSGSAVQLIADTMDQAWKATPDGSQSQPSVLLNDPLTVPTSRVWHDGYSSDGQWVLYLADEQVAGTLELFARPIDGSLGPILLDGALPPGGDVGSTPSPRTGPTSP